MSGPPKDGTRIIGWFDGEMHVVHYDEWEFLGEKKSGWVSEQPGAGAFESDPGDWSPIPSEPVTGGAAEDGIILTDPRPYESGDLDGVVQCSWCGRIFPFGTGGRQRALFAAVDHTVRCAKNPLVIAIKGLSEQKQADRKRIRELETEVLNLSGALALARGQSKTVEVRDGPDG